MSDVTSGWVQGMWVCVDRIVYTQVLAKIQGNINEVLRVCDIRSRCVKRVAVCWRGVMCAEGV